MGSRSSGGLGANVKMGWREGLRERWDWGDARVRRGGRAHSVRPESCDSPSSPEPAASLYGGADWERVSPFQGWGFLRCAPGALPGSIILRLYEAGEPSAARLTDGIF
jgi:hypothetical protein